MIDLTIFADALNRSVELAKERQIIIPTFKQQRDPSLIPEKIVNKLKNVGLWDLDPSSQKAAWPSTIKDGLTGS